MDEKKVVRFNETVEIREFQEHERELEARRKHIKSIRRWRKYNRALRDYEKKEEAENYLCKEQDSSCCCVN